LPAPKTHWIKALFPAFVVAFLVAAPAAAACPNVGLKRQTVTLLTDSGAHDYKLEIAASPEEQACGLMFREFMPKSIGMIFPFKPPRDTAFWMRNTPLPLDLIFVAANGRVISIGQGKPFSTDFIPAGGVTAHVIELNQGEAARIGLKKGDRIRFRD
jgi:hypothetical protein